MYHFVVKLMKTDSSQTLTDVRTMNDSSECNSQNNNRVGIVNKQADTIVPTNCEPVIHAVNQEDDPYNLSGKTEKPKRPAINYFPLRVFKKQKLSFSKTWYNLFSWLEYSVSRDTAFCFPWRHFALGDYMDSAFVRSGFSNWKYALQKFRDHEITE
ncbi:hypothetical protein PR048_012888 [Dryococelus australis]|uniref:TTF-type domain-containing protein n=1 Tax=Dryococelus australis TaxID=614101 RepID=A0ABQ9HQS4_9NEOP|nr:hypothetical protein PR048_012888 [Dryococelus australis]